MAITSGVIRGCLVLSSRLYIIAILFEKRILSHGFFCVLHSKSWEITPFPTLCALMDFMGSYTRHWLCCLPIVMMGFVRGSINKLVYTPSCAQIKALIFRKTKYIYQIVTNLHVNVLCISNQTNNKEFHFGSLI